jgi:hypothetical protein
VFIEAKAAGMRKLLPRTDGRLLVYASIVIGSLLAGILVVAPFGQAQALDGGGPCSACVCHTSR